MRGSLLFRSCAPYETVLAHVTRRTRRGMLRERGDWTSCERAFGATQKAGGKRKRGPGPAVSEGQCPSEALVVLLGTLMNGLFTAGLEQWKHPCPGSAGAFPF